MGKLLVLAVLAVVVWQMVDRALAVASAGNRPARRRWSARASCSACGRR